MDKAEAFLEELVEYLLVTCKNDDYITPEVICRKLAKYGYIELENGYWINPLADCKTENSSEKPNNSTISKMEQVETMSCEECKHYGTHHPCELDFKACRYEPKDEPQTDCAWR